MVSHGRSPVPEVTGGPGRIASARSRWLTGAGTFLAAMAVTGGSLASSPSFQRLPPSVRSPLVGAYYSDWFPSNSSQGTTRQHLLPAQGADPTKVDSADPRIAEQAIAQATQNGIGFFALDWWPLRASQNANIDAFLRARNLGDIKFCIFYETWDLGFIGGAESTPVGPAMEARFDADLLHIARTYFSNPSYLRIQGRPVLDLYLTRTLTGNVGALMAGARRLLRSHGYNPYIIGDEIFWRVTPTSPLADGSVLTQTPQASRIDLFDAITAYSLYAGGPADPLVPSSDFEGYPGTTSIVADEIGLYTRYLRATGGQVPVVPDVLPGINTRGTRLQVNEPAQPRQWLPGESSASTLQHELDQIARPVIEARLPLVFVTSWNEWNEDTGIQPVGGIPTSKDNSFTGSAYTQGYTYGGEGRADLGALRDFVGVAWGQVRSASGRPVAHAEVFAFRDGTTVSAARTDSEGWYVLPRTRWTTGFLTVVAWNGAKAMRSSQTAATRLDLTV